MPLRKKSSKGGAKRRSSKSATPKFTAQLGDGTVQGQKLQAEFLKRANDWIFKNTSRAIDLFRQFDTNGDGVLSHEEFRKGMANLKAPFTEAEVEEVIKMIDTDGSGDLDYREFQSGLRYRSQKTPGKESDGLPPLLLLREPLQPCSHCGLGLWQPQPADARYVELQLKLLPFHERPHPAHFTVAVCDAITVYGIAQLVNKHLGSATTELTIYRKAEASDESELDQSLTLSQCGVSGASRRHPTPATFFFDYLPVLSECPILMAEHYFTGDKRRRHNGHTSLKAD